MKTVRDSNGEETGDPEWPRAAHGLVSARVRSLEVNSTSGVNSSLEQGVTEHDQVNLNQSCSGVAAHMAIGAVRVYQWTIRPLIGSHCRFWPGCSDYAIDALRRHGAVRGGALAARRVLRCNPWHEGGWDPVPEPIRPTGL